MLKENGEKPRTYSGYGIHDGMESRTTQSYRPARLGGRRPGGHRPGAGFVGVSEGQDLAVEDRKRLA